MSFNRLAASLLGAGVVLAVSIALVNYFALSSHLHLEPVDRLQTSIDVFVASITAMGVVYAGLNLRLVTNAQTETKSMQEARYIQDLMDEWNLDVEKNLLTIQREGIPNRAEQLLKILWFFDKVSAAMKSCSSLRRRLLPRFMKDYWNVRRFLERNAVVLPDVIPVNEVEEFVRLGPEFLMPSGD